MTNAREIELGELMPQEGRSSVNPADYPGEVFELLSIPAYDRGSAEIALGSEIGSTKQAVHPGDVLLSKIVPHIRRAWVVEPSAGSRQIASSEWIVFRSKEADARYLRHFLVSDGFHRQFMQTVSGVGGSLLRARPKYVAKIKIPLPPLEEQRRIAAILDKAGNLRQHAYGQLCHAKDLLASLFIKTIGEPLQNPHDWSTLPLAEAVQAGTDVTYGIVQAGEEFPGGIPYIRTGDIVDGEIDVSALRHTDPAIASRFVRSTVRTGEIIMSIRATVGTTAVVPPCLDGANLTQGTARVAPGKNVNGVYLLQYLRMPSTQAWIQRQVKGATFREITLARLRELPVLIPPMAIQDKFADKAMLANSAIDSSKVLLSRIENLSLSLGNQLLGRKQ
jgi:type I restriction enzyme S subunit